MIDWIGQKLGNYQIIRLLGHGGFANVYLGQHIYLQTYAAIKVLQARLADKDLETFLKEARTIANLNHPHIVRVLEFGEEGYTPYLVMEYCPNGTLRQRHPKETHVSLSECIDYLTQVAQALQYAHEHKIVHRDVKPENMLISRNGTILLSDFGIAVISQSSRYQHQDIGGTIAYAAPEQLQGKAGPASNQYALGIVLYEWLSGQLPYQGSFSEIASQHLFAPLPPIHERVPSLPPAVEMVLEQALAKDPQQRFGNVQELATALEQAAINTPTLRVQSKQSRESQGNLSTYHKTQPAVPLEIQIPPDSSAVRQTPVFSPPPLAGSISQPVQEGSHQKRKDFSKIIIVILLLLLVTVSARAFLFTPEGNFQHRNASDQHSSSLHTTPLSTSTFTLTPTVSPTPTPSSQILKINRKLLCVTTGGCFSEIFINTFIIDSNQFTIELTLKSVPTGLGSPARDFENAIFLSFAWQDPNGAEYEPDGGLAKPYNSISLAANQSLNLEAIYHTFIPQKGVTYTLSVIFYCKCTALPDTFQGEQFTF